MSSANRKPILQMIFGKIRRLTGSSDPVALPDVSDHFDPNSFGLADYVNSFYFYDFPLELRSLKLEDFYTFETQKGIDTYAFDSEKFISVKPPAFCRDIQMLFFQNASEFHRYGNFLKFAEQVFSGNGTTSVPDFVLQDSPILRSYNNDPTNLNYPASRIQNILITGNTGTTNTPTLNATDDGNGNIIGDASGTIDYTTGAISNLIFSSAIPANEKISVQYRPYKPSIPTAILFNQNQFTLRPIPDKGYTIKISAQRQPTQVLADTPAFAGNPELSEWWELIAVGASKKIFEDRGDLEGVAMMDKMLLERYALAERRTHIELGKQRVKTLFQSSDSSSDNLGYANWPFPLY